MTRALARSCSFAKENKARVVPIVKRSLRLDDDLVTKIFDYHKPVETPDGRIDANLMADTIRHSSQADGITKEKRCRRVRSSIFPTCPDNARKPKKVRTLSKSGLSI